MKRMKHEPLSTEGQHTILAGAHYWPEGSPRPYTLEEMLQMTMHCKGVDAKRFELIKIAVGISPGTLFDKQTGRHVLQREARGVHVQVKKPMRKAPVVSRGGVIMSQAMQAASRVSVVHAHRAD